jgi:hypothetical protein
MDSLLLDRQAPTAPQVIKAISLWEPWASLVARGVRRHDTRTWATEYRGPLAIHAAKTLSLAGAPARLCASALGYDWWDTRPLGCVVAVAVLKDCKPAHKLDLDTLTRADREGADFGWGRFAFEFTDVRPLRQPIPLAGRQALFNWTAPADLESLLGAPRDHLAACHQIGWGRGS